MIHLNVSGIWGTLPLQSPPFGVTWPRRWKVAIKFAYSRPWESKTKQSGWSLGWSMGRKDSQSFHGARFGRLGPPGYAWSPNDLYFGRSIPKNKAFSNQNKGHLDSTYISQSDTIPCTFYFGTPPMNGVMTHGLSEFLAHLANKDTNTFWTKHLASSLHNTQVGKQIDN